MEFDYERQDYKSLAVNVLNWYHQLGLEGDAGALAFIEWQAIEHDIKQDCKEAVVQMIRNYEEPEPVVITQSTIEMFRDRYKRANETRGSEEAALYFLNLPLNVRIALRKEIEIYHPNSFLWV